MKNRICLLIALMLLSINLMVSRRAYAGEIEFTYDELRHTFETPSLSEYVKSNLEEPFSIEIPSACLRSDSGYVYEARIINAGELGDYDNDGKVVFSVLNDGKVSGDTCGGSFVKRFLLWGVRREGGEIVGVRPAIAVRIEQAKDNIINVVLSVPAQENSGWCGPVMCPH